MTKLASARRPRLLIVDDDASIRTLLRVATQRGDLFVDEAADGAQCLDLLTRNQYDVILLDLAMPRLNGFDVVAAFGEMKKPRPAVIVLTALESSVFGEVDSTVVHCIVRKPFDVQMLSALVVAIAIAMRDAEPLTAPPWRDTERLELC